MGAFSNNFSKFRGLTCAIIRNFTRLAEHSETSLSHHVPRGSLWFDLVACPHFTLEIMLYLAVWAVLGWGHPGWISVLCFVVDRKSVV